MDIMLLHKPVYVKTYRANDDAAKITKKMENPMVLRLFYYLSINKRISASTSQAADPYAR